MSIIKQTFVVLLVVLVSCRSKDPSGNKAENNASDEIMFPFGVTKFNWDAVEKHNDAAKAAFVKIAPTLINYQYTFYSEQHHEKEFAENCHVLDINNDGLDDIIYNGSTGGEGSQVVVFLKTKNGFKKIFTRLQHIVKLEFRNHKLFRIFILDDGCCSEYVDFNYVYQLDYNGDIPKFVAVYLSSNHHGSYFPSAYFKRPIYFQVLNNNYKLRKMPVIDDTTKNGVEGIAFKGNNIDTLNKGTKGRAVAAQTDKTGRVWWLVEIDPSYKAYGFLFYESQEEPNRRASKVGWISSRFVKKIERY